MRQPKKQKKSSSEGEPFYKAAGYYCNAVRTRTSTCTVALELLPTLSEVLLKVWVSVCKVTAFCPSVSANVPEIKCSRDNRRRKRGAARVRYLLTREGTVNKLA